MKNLSVFDADDCGFSPIVPSNKYYVINQLFACAVYGLLFIPTVLLNSISIFTILKCSQLNEKVSYFTILVQSAVDLITGVVTLPILTAFVLLKDIIRVENKIICWLNYTFGYFLPGLSLLTLCALSFERYMGVLHPFIHRTQVTKKRIMIYECCTGLPLLVYVFSQPINSTETGNIVIIAVVLISSLFLLFVYTRIFVKARTSLYSGNRPGNRVAQPDTSEVRGKRRFLRELKLAKSCFLVTCTFGLCFLPSIVLSWPTLHLEDETFEMIWCWTIALPVANSSVNSIIFFWSKAKLRKEAMKVLKICCS